MKVTFLGQGFESTSINAVGNYLIKILSQTDFHSFTGMSAFASEAGVFGLAGFLQDAKQNFKNLTLIVGIDQYGTSKEALEEILLLSIDSYIFYQKEAPIFHPKIYLFEGGKHTKLILGSSNLTRTGLFSNVESSVLIEFDSDDVEGIALLTELKTYYQSLFDFSDRNLFKITSERIADFVAKGIVPDEIQRKQIYSKNLAISNTLKNNKIEGNINIPKRRVSNVPAIFPTKHKRRSKQESESIPLPTESNSDQEVKQVSTESFFTDFIQEETVLWNSGPLSERDLNIPKGLNTNPTGSILIKKGELKDIDQRHYFRDQVFKDLNWNKDNRSSTSHYERAEARFYIIIDDSRYGPFELQLSHNTRTNTQSYRQKQPMTSLSWGDAKPIIAREQLIGKSAKLYRNPLVKDEYVLVID